MSTSSSPAVPVPPQGRQERRKQQTRRRIQDAAAALFAERGSEATTVADICARADVAHQTFFNHFPRKRDLLEQLFRTGVDLLCEALEEACERAPSTRERLAWFFGSWAQRAAGVGPLSRELTDEIVRANRDTVGVQEAGRISDAFLALVQRGLALGDVRRDHAPAVLAQLVEGALHSLMTGWSADPAVDLEQRAAQLAALVADALEPAPERRR